jgi:alpha-tubulin suppressor-like RCC1 family protein
LITNYSTTYAVDESISAWVVDLFGALLGYNDIKDGAEYKRERKPIPPLVPKETQKPKPAAAEPRQTSAPVHEAVKKPMPTLVPTPIPAVAKPVFSDYSVRITADYHTVAVTPDGKTRTAGFNEDGQCNTWWWRGIESVVTGTHFTVALKKDGTLHATGRNDYRQINVSGWQGVKQLSAGMRHTVGLRHDGTVIAAGDNAFGECNVHKWRHLEKVIAGCQCTFGIKKDGRVLFTGENWTGALRVLHLYNVAHIECTMAHRGIVLHRNGTVRWLGEDDALRREMEKYKDIVQISGAPDYFAALFKDGSVRILKYFWLDTGIEGAVNEWKDIKAIAAGRYHIVGVRKDGKVLAAMLHPDPDRDKGQCNVEGWEI